MADQFPANEGGKPRPHHHTKCCGSRSASMGSVRFRASCSSSGSNSHKCGSNSRSFHHLAKKERKTLIFRCFVTSVWIFIFKEWSGSTSGSRFWFVWSSCFCASQIPIQIRLSEVKIWRSGSASRSAPKCHGSAKLVESQITSFLWDQSWRGLET